MACYSPLDGWQNAQGEVVVVKRGLVHPAGFYRYVSLPCGKCIGCRLEYTRQWAVRCLHEASMHDQSWFVTLTYDDEHCPGALVHEDFRAFMKRLRRLFPGVKYFMCGEYGERFDRPHFHSCVFGLSLTDLVLHSTNNGMRLYTSEVLSNVWSRGFVSVGAVTFESAQYCASYVMKKVIGNSAAAETLRSRFSLLDPVTGELSLRVPEYCRMSLRPAIGRTWFDKYGVSDVLPYDHVVMQGYAGKPPRYYDKIARGVDSRRRRVEFGAAREVDSTAARLKVRESVVRGRLKLKERKL